MLTKLFQELLLLASFRDSCSINSNPAVVILPGATFALVLSTFEHLVIVVASHWLFGLGLLMTEQAEQKLVARVGASATFPLVWHWTTVDF